MNEGVEACRVANRSGVRAEADMLQPAVNTKIVNVKISLVLLNRFKEALLTSQNFCADTAAIRTSYLFINRLIFLEASHTLHFGSDKTEVQVHVFRRRALAEYAPMGLKRGWIKLGDFAEGDVQGFNYATL